MDFANGANGISSGGLYMANMKQQPQQYVSSNPQMVAMPLPQQAVNNPSLTGAPMSNGDFQHLMMGNIGSVMPSSQTIASFVHRPQDMLCVGNSANAIFDPSQTLKNSNSNSIFSIQQANNGGQNMFLNQNAMIQHQQPQQQQQLNAMPQAMPQPQQYMSNESSNSNSNSVYQNALFEQQRQHLQQQHELQRQQLKLQQAQRLQEHEQLQEQKRRNKSLPEAISYSFPQQSPFLQQQAVKMTTKPQRAVSAPIAALKENTIADSNNDSFTNFTTDFFDMPHDFMDSVDDNLFSDTTQPASMPPQAKKCEDAPPRSAARPPITTSRTTTSTTQRVSASSPSARSPTSVSSSSTPLVLPPKTAPVVVNKAVHPPASSLLHQACFLYPTTVAVVNSALGVESNNVRRRVPTPAPIIPMNDAGSNKRRKLVEPFSLPLHIALDNDASEDVIEALIKAGPGVISMTDGPDGCTALSVALNKNCSPGTIALLVFANPKAVEVVDGHHNTALHVGCSKGASIEVMKLLYRTYPKALTKSNFHSQTPLDVAQQTTVCPLSVIDFLQALVLESLECKASHLVTSEDDELVEYYLIK
jgi:hypothetical protein